MTHKREWGLITPDKYVCIASLNEAYQDLENAEYYLGAGLISDSLEKLDAALKSIEKVRKYCCKPSVVESLTYMHPNGECEIAFGGAPESCEEYINDLIPQIEEVKKYINAGESHKAIKELALIRVKLVGFISGFGCWVSLYARE